MTRRACPWRIVLALAAGLLVLSVSPGRRASAQSGATLAGQVISIDEVALEGAVVSLEGIGNARSDVTGSFIFREVSPGNYRLTVNMEGFPTETRSILVHERRLNKVRIVLRGSAPSATTPVAVGVPVMHQGSAILVRGRLNGQVDTLLAVDTGATYCLLFKATAERLGFAPSHAAETVRLFTASGSIKAPLVLLELIEVGGVDARGIETVIHDVSGLPPEVGGILGLSFLRRFNVEIDHAKGILVLRR